MHFALILLFCSLISVSVGAGPKKPGKGATTAKTSTLAFHRVKDKPQEADKLKKGQIVGVRPKDFIVSCRYTIATPSSVTFYRV